MSLTVRHVQGDHNKGLLWIKIKNGCTLYDQPVAFLTFDFWRPTPLLSRFAHLHTSGCSLSRSRRKSVRSPWWSSPTWTEGPALAEPNRARSRLRWWNPTSAATAAPSITVRNRAKRATVLTGLVGLTSRVGSAGPLVGFHPIWPWHNDCGTSAQCDFPLTLALYVSPLLVRGRTQSDALLPSSLIFWIRPQRLFPLHLRGTVSGLEDRIIVTFKKDSDWTNHLSPFQQLEVTLYYFQHRQFLAKCLNFI